MNAVQATVGTWDAAIYHVTADLAIATRETRFGGAPLGGAVAGAVPRWPLLRCAVRISARHRRSGDAYGSRTWS